MANPILFDIPHTLGRDEARRRINDRLPKLTDHIPGVGAIGSSWPSPDHLAMTVAAMAQTIGVDFFIEDTLIKGRIELPLLLSAMARPIVDTIKANAQTWLEPPRG